MSFETNKNEGKTTENLSNNNLTDKMISNPQINFNEAILRARHFSERMREGIPNISNLKEKQIQEELDEIDKLLIKEPLQKEGFLHDEDFALKNEEFNVNGENLRFKGLKMKKIGNMNFLSDLRISKQ